MMYRPRNPVPPVTAIRMFGSFSLEYGASFPYHQRRARLSFYRSGAMGQNGGEGHVGGGRGLTRRGFLVGTGAGVLVGAPLGWLGLRGWQALEQHLRPSFNGQSQEVAN